MPRTYGRAPVRHVPRVMIGLKSLPLILKPTHAFTAKEKPKHKAKYNTGKDRCEFDGIGIVVRMSKESRFSLYKCEKRRGTSQLILYLWLESNLAAIGCELQVFKNPKSH